MSTALPFVSGLQGAEYGFVGGSAAESALEVEALRDTSSNGSLPANAPATVKRVATAAIASEEAHVPAAEGVSAPPYNRICQVREQQGVSQRTMARRLGIDLKSYQVLERPETDLRLSQLSALQAALEVPMIELLEDTQTLSRPVAERAKMIKVMKTAASLRETSGGARIERMVQTLCEQLVDVMPELAEVSSWPQYGSRRGNSAIGKVLAQQISVADLGFPE